jgi:tetratricopeptide (TPR) repeat protein
MLIKRLSFLICFCLSVFLGVSQSNANETFKSGLSAYVAGDYEMAINKFNTAISLDPTRNYFFYNRGMAYKAKGNNQAAMADFQRSNDLKPTPETHYQIGVIKYKSDDFKGAKAEFESAKLLREDLDNMNFYLGMIYFKEKNYEEALKCYELFTARVKTNADAFYYRGFCEAKLGKNPEALISLKQALIYKDRDWKFYFKMYEVYLAMGDKTNALNNISMVIEKGDGTPEFYEDRAKLYLDQGDSTKYSEDLASAKQLKDAGPAQVNKNSKPSNGNP